MGRRCAGHLRELTCTCEEGESRNAIALEERLQAAQPIRTKGGREGARYQTANQLDGFIEVLMA